MERTQPQELVEESFDGLVPQEDISNVYDSEESAKERHHDTMLVTENAKEVYANDGLSEDITSKKIDFIFTKHLLVVFAHTFLQWLLFGSAPLHKRSHLYAPYSFK